MVDTVEIGQPAPDFDLPSSPTGDRFRLSDSFGTNAVVINFIPAAFSRGCGLQLPVIESWRDRWSDMGAIPVTISCDNAWSLAAWKESVGVDFPLLSDFHPHGEVARSYGVFLEKRGIADRAVFVVDIDGRIAAIQRPNSISDIPDYDPVSACLVPNVG